MTMPTSQQVAPMITRSNIAASAHIPEDAEHNAPITYVHTAKNSTFIMPDGEILQFKQAGRVGHLTVTCPRAQAELNAAMRKGAPISILDVEVQEAYVRKELTPAERAQEMLLASNRDRIQDVSAALVAQQNGKSVQLPEGVENKTLVGAVNSQSVIAAAANSIAK
jgi:hypothetical protein